MSATKAILAVSFGTSFEDTRKVTIDAIERDFAAAYPDRRVYRAWTSKMIIKKLLSRDGIRISTVREAMEEMRSDGITDLVVQPTHVINGIENDLMKEDVLSCGDGFSSIVFGAPLLTTEEDSDAVIRAVAEEFSSLDSRDALILMGHGTTHYANSIYAALDYRFKDMGYPNIFLGTVEAYPSMESLKRRLREFGPRRLVLAPFMIVAGDHARHDMAGDDPESWYSQFAAEGYHADCVLKGLGEYKAVRALLCAHIADALSKER